MLPPIWLAGHRQKNTDLPSVIHQHAPALAACAERCHSDYRFSHRAALLVSETRSRFALPLIVNDVVVRLCHAPSADVLTVTAGLVFVFRRREIINQHRRPTVRCQCRLTVTFVACANFRLGILIPEVLLFFYSDQIKLDRLRQQNRSWGFAPLRILSTRRAARRTRSSGSAP